MNENIKSISFTINRRESKVVDNRIRQSEILFVLTEPGEGKRIRFNRTDNQQITKITKFLSPYPLHQPEIVNPLEVWLKVDETLQNYSFFVIFYQKISLLVELMLVITGTRCSFACRGLTSRIDHPQIGRASVHENSEVLSCKKIRMMINQ